MRGHGTCTRRGRDDFKFCPTSVGLLRCHRICRQPSRDQVGGLGGRDNGMADGRTDCKKGIRRVSECSLGHWDVINRLEYWDGRADGRTARSPPRSQRRPPAHRQKSAGRSPPSRPPRPPRREGSFVYAKPVPSNSILLSTSPPPPLLPLARRILELVIVGCQRGPRRD